MLTRRAVLWGGAVAAGTVRLAGAEWSRKLDRAVLEAALRRMDEAYDPSERMLARELGPGYQYHTNLRGVTAHPTRASLDYALYLLEDGSRKRRERAVEILERVLALQETDRGSRWYGLWGWYLEEPPPQMSPADWNWADFNGTTLLMIERRHGKRLPEKVREQVLAAIRLAAYSVRRREVSMSYTNIAVKGTFVTLAAAELLNLEDLREYAKRRMYRLARHIDGTGSFNEYNSPTYTEVMLADLTRMRMVVRAMEMKKLAGRIEERAWLHFATHWHAGSRQLAGPMSRCYGDGIGRPLWLQKALDGALEFATLEEIGAGRLEARGETAVLDFECPRPLRHYFLEPGEERMHRELFQNAEPPEPPLAGATWLALGYCVGSANKADFWVQRRPLLAYWGPPSQPPHSLRLRLLKDDYDFASGLFHSVQERGCVLGLLSFRSPGGDRHISLDPIKDGAFECARLRLRVDLTGVDNGARMLIDGKSAAAPLRDLPPGSRVAIDLGGAYAWLLFPRAVFGASKPRLSIEPEDGLLAVSLDLKRADAPQTVRWTEVGTAWATFSLVMEAAEGTLEEFSLRCAMGSFEQRDVGYDLRVIWRSPAGRLWLQGLPRVATVKEHNRAFRAGIRSAGVPVVRLSDEKLV